VAEWYWAEPGYSEPYGLTPVDRWLVLDTYNQRRAEPTLAGRKRLDLVKRAAAVSGLAPLLVPEWLVVADRTESGTRPLERVWEAASRACPGLPSVSRPVAAVTTNSLGHKVLLRVFDRATHRLACVLKVSRDPVGNAGLLKEHETLELVHRSAATDLGTSVRVPRPLGRFTELGCLHTVEEGMDGMSAARRLFAKAPTRWLRALETWLPTYVECANATARTLAQTGMESARRSEPCLRLMLRPDDTAAASLHDRVSQSKAICDSGWVQHGDFTIENLIHREDRAPASFGVVDWEHCAGGFPPLYDVFCLLVSCLPAVDSFRAGSEAGWPLAFEDAFFRTTRWSALFSACLRSAAREARVPEDDLWSAFCAFLLIRWRHFTGKGLGPVHETFIRIAAANGGSFVPARPERVL
jgi:hypothetical protein